jgi:hypothetical protein
MNDYSSNAMLCCSVSDPVPVVLLVVEGGPNTVQTGRDHCFVAFACRRRSFASLVHEAVVKNNIPAVFLEGTGRCCDLFAKAVRLYNEYREKLELEESNSPK